MHINNYGPPGTHACCNGYVNLLLKVANGGIHEEFHSLDGRGGGGRSEHGEMDISTKLPPFRSAAPSRAPLAAAFLAPVAAY